MPRSIFRTRYRNTVLALGVCAATGGFLVPLAAPAAADTDASAQGSFGGEECWATDESELRFFEKVNQARVAHGRRALTLDPELSRVAQRHSYRMKVAQRLFHTPTVRLHRQVTNWDILGENVGRGRTPDTLHSAFMQSKAHRHVLLSKEFTFVGVGVSYEDGRLWATILFHASDDPGTTMDMTPC